MPSRWYLITWTTHGSWLPGDPRGFRTYGHRVDIPPPKRYADSKDVYKPDDWKRLFEYHKRKCKEAVSLDKKQQAFVHKRITEIAVAKGCSVKAIHVSGCHVHVLIRHDRSDLSGLVQRIKGITSRELSEYGLKGKVWARGYHARPIPDNALAEAIHYILFHNK